MDAQFAAQQTTIFDKDLGLSKPISLAAWRARPLRERVAERLASMIGSQL